MSSKKPDVRNMNQKEVLEFLIEEHRRCKQELRQVSVDSADLDLKIRGICMKGDERANLSRKSTALTAHFIAQQNNIAIIECIENLGVFDGAIKQDIKQLLYQKHASLMRNSQKGANDIMRFLTIFIEAALQAVSTGRRANFTELGTKLSGSWLRTQKDIAILNWLHSFGVSSKTVHKSDL